MEQIRTKIETVSYKEEKIEFTFFLTTRLTQ